MSQCQSQESFKNIHLQSISKVLNKMKNAYHIVMLAPSNIIPVSPQTKLKIDPKHSRS